jgi:hypothetical protein
LNTVELKVDEKVDQMASSMVDLMAVCSADPLDFEMAET